MSGLGCPTVTTRFVIAFRTSSRILSAPLLPSTDWKQVKLQVITIPSMPSSQQKSTAETVAPLGIQIFNFEVKNGLDEVRRLDETASGTSTDLYPFFFSSNGCTRGDRCQWRHARNDRLIVCKHYLRGLCKKQDLCDYLHSVDYGRMPECFFYSKYGECSNAECPYRHVDPEKKKNECPYYARGFCRHGPKCRHRHVKKVACPNYLAGFCKDGPDCVFGHARFEIPKSIDDDDVFSNGIDRFGFGRLRGPAPRLIQLCNGMLATAAGISGPPGSNNNPNQQQPQPPQQPQQQQ